MEKFRYTITKPFHIGSQVEQGKTVQLDAKEGDIITIADKNVQSVYIKTLNDKPIYSIWMRKAYVLAHTDYMDKFKKS